MIDYYAELGLDRSQGLDGLKTSLTRAESVWKQRRTRGNPAVANKKLVLIEEARREFATEESRADYDRRLDAGDSTTEAAATIRQFESWRSQAQGYLDAGQADLAVAAVERALASPGAQSADADFYLLACHAYLDVGNYSSAVRYANEAILLAPDNPLAYIEKATILDWKGLSERQQGRHSEAYQSEEQLRKLLIQASSIAQKDGQRQAQGTALGFLALSLYFREPTDQAQAVAYASEAMKHGDLWGNAKRVLDKAAADKKQRAQEELQRRQEAARQAKEKAEQELRLKRADEERRKAEEESQRKADEAKRKAEAARAKKSFYKILATIGWFALLYCAYLAFWPVVNPDGGSFEQKMALYDIATTRTMLLVAIAWLKVFDGAANSGDGSTSGFYGGILVFGHSFILATANYTQLGFSAASANEAWKVFGMSLAAYIAVMWICSKVGKALSKGAL